MTLKLAHIGAEKDSDQINGDGYAITYNFDYKREGGGSSLVRFEGEFDSTSLSGILKMAKALGNLY